MKIKGKFYLLANIGASAQSHFVAAEPTGAKVEITTDPRKTAFFDTSEQAQDRQKTAEATLPYEFILCRVTKDLLPQVKSQILRPVEG